MHPQTAFIRLLIMGYLSRVSVIGNNTKAARLAAWLANSGCQVNLLGVVAKDTFDLEPIAKSLLYIPEFGSRIKTGLVRDNLEPLRKSTWIHDCNSSNADIKESLYSAIDSLISPDAVLTTDDTLLPLETYTSGRSQALTKRFFVLQFAEPAIRPSYGEYASTASTEQARMLAFIAEISETTGITLQKASLSPGLTALRLTLLYCMQAISIAERLQIDVVQADRYSEALGLVQPFRYVDSSTFNDLLTLSISISQEYGLSGIPRPLRALYESPKHSRSFYSSETGQSAVLDLQTLAYRGALDEIDPAVEAVKRLPIEERIQKASSLQGSFGEYAREISKAVRTLISLLKIKQEITEDHLRLALLHGVGMRVPHTEPEALNESLEPDVQESVPIETSQPSTIELPYPAISLQQARDLTERIIAMGQRPFTVCGSEDGFCAGFDIQELLGAIADNGKEGLLEYALEYQRLVRAFSSARCVAAIGGKCHGLGLEIALACTKIVADAGSQFCMDHARYGLLPMAGGSARLRMLAQSGGAKKLADLALALATGKSATNAYESIKLGLIPTTIEIVAHPKKLRDVSARWMLSLTEAKTADWEQIQGPLLGMIDQAKSAARLKGELGPHGELLMDKAKALLSKPTSLQSAQDLETETFVDLAGKALSQARMRYTISTGKTLNN